MAVLWLGASLSTATVGASLSANGAAADTGPVLRILQPVPGTPVTAHPVLVRGTIEPADADAQIRVNGGPVFLVQNGEWATLLDLPAGVHTLSAELRAAGRLLTRVESRVTVAGPVSDEWPLAFTGGVMWPFAGTRTVPIGTPPHNQLFRIHSDRGVTEGQLDPEGSGRLARPLRLGEYYTHAFRAPGLYAPTLRYTHSSGAVFAQQALVVVYDRAWLEPILQDLWAAFRAAMARNDREAALALVHSGPPRLLAHLMFEQLDPPELKRWAAMLGPITLVRVAGSRALCRTEKDGAGIEFAPDGLDGRWRYWMR